MDIKPPAQRSENMAKIRSKNTKQELFIRSQLHRSGYRFRVNFTGITGHPDLWFPRRRVAVFVNGCYWHRHAGCKLAYTPKSNVAFWTGKFEANKARDSVVKDALAQQGVRVLVIWECAVKQMQKDQKALDASLQAIRAFLDTPEIHYLEL